MFDISWNCPQCTFLNEKCYYMCEMCEYECETFQFKNEGTYMKSFNRKERVYNVFKKDKILLPVIHVIDINQTIKNIDIIIECECDGIFLVNHELEYKIYFDIVKKIKVLYPNLWIGINCISLKPFEIFNYIEPNIIDGLWVDNAYITDTDKPQNIAEYMLHYFSKNKFTGLYFGGISSKYNYQAKDLALQTKNAINYIDIITSSGNSTGEPINIEKLKIIYDKCKDTNYIGICSGISLDNYEDIISYCNIFIVNTHFCDDEIFNIEKLKLFSKLLKK